jgi:hypothetical protein
MPVENAGKIERGYNEKKKGREEMLRLIAQNRTGEE